MEPVDGVEEDQARRDSTTDPESGSVKPVKPKVLEVYQVPRVTNDLTKMMDILNDQWSPLGAITNSHVTKTMDTLREFYEPYGSMESTGIMTSIQLEINKEQEGFFNLLTHVQGARIDEQRCSIQIVHSKGEQDGKNSPPVTPPPEMNHLMDMLAQSQSRRLDDQRAEFTHSPSFPDTMPTRRVSHDNGGLKDAEVPVVPFSSGEDYFSLINQVHSRHLEKHIKNRGGRK
ncbi:Purkinje cell protein 2 homolog [Dendropsophus ebraccatus]|uniref:Purkinje cell protein 2 homolog n=1 Tax=Dendropsophus ebraccatus TaxID=150705 RepID=UPI00383182A5